LFIALPLWAEDEIEVESHELLFTCCYLREKSDSMSKLGPSRQALDRPPLASRDGAVQARRKDFLSTHAVVYKTSNVQRRLTKADPHMIVSAIDL
jgi:hypothetical protein